MNKQYEVVWCEVKKTGEKNGKPWSITTMTLKDLSDGTEIEKVDTFDTVAPGHKIEGEITSGQYGMNFKKAPTAKAVAGANFKAQQVEKTIDYKDQKIVKNMDAKDWSIMTSSSMGNAVNLAIAESKDTPDYNFEQRIQYWRKFILDNWEVEKTDIPAFK